MTRVEVMIFVSDEMDYRVYSKIAHAYKTIFLVPPETSFGKDTAIDHIQMQINKEFDRLSKLTREMVHDDQNKTE